MWINDGENPGVEEKSVEFTVDCVVGGGAVTESENCTVNICHCAGIL